MEKSGVTIVGGGLAGSEAAWQAARQGVEVSLYEMRPVTCTPAHKTGYLAELVCSNSLGSQESVHAAGILKEEMRRLGSLVIRTADGTKVPAGSALAVDREIFSRKITEAIERHPRIHVIREEIKEVPTDTPVIIATGPLTSDHLTEQLRELNGVKHLYFYDSISPIIDGETINEGVIFRASRYNRGGPDYVNCPFSEEEYNRFYDALIKAERALAKPFEKIPYFEGCVPVEVLAERGKKTLLFGPMKPVGLMDPRSRKRPYAVVQLRQEDQFGSCYNMVGFQTKLTWPEQRRVLRMIPGLEQAEFFRYGSVHRNTFINSPLLLRETLQMRGHRLFFFAGQIVGVEGYTESAAMGLLAGINVARLLKGQSPVVPPPTTAMGTLTAHISRSDPRHFQPMNTNFGLFPPLPERILDRIVRRKTIAARAIADLDVWIEQYGILKDISE